MRDKKPLNESALKNMVRTVRKDNAVFPALNDNLETPGGQDPSENLLSPEKFPHQNLNTEGP